MKKTKSNVVGNRTIIGVICILCALGICFGIAPLINRLQDGKTEVVRMVRDVPMGSIVNDADVTLEKVGSFNLPPNIITKKEDIVGKTTAVDLFVGEYVLSVKIGEVEKNASYMLENLGSEKKAISVTIGSFALGFSGKLECGDIATVIVFDDQMQNTMIPKELTYLQVITTTTSGGVDQENLETFTQPVTVTFLVNAEQAQLLAYYEKKGNMHIALEYRGDAETAQRYLDEQDKVFGGG